MGLGVGAGVQACWVAVLMFQGSYNKGLRDAMTIQRDKGNLHNIFKEESTKFDN